MRVQDLDGQRTAEGKQESELRRRAANTRVPAVGDSNTQDAAIDAAMLVEPARSWVESMEKARFLLRRYSETQEAYDERIQKLIKRAMGDMARLKEREENGT